MNKECAAGAMSGLAQNIIGHPFDTAKIYMQNKMPLWNMKPHHYYRGFMYPTAYSIVSHGLLFPIHSAFYKTFYNHYSAGFASGIVIGPMCYLFEWYKVKRQVFCTKKLSWKLPGFTSTIMRESFAYITWFGSYFDLTQKYKWSPFYAGGVAGMLAWTVSFPFDTIRNRQVAQHISFQEAYRQGRFWKGYSICMLRAYLVNSIGFAVYDRFI